MSAHSSYRLEVAPLVLLPLDRSPFFSYWTPAPISLGSLVSIPFGSRIIRGVVFACVPLHGPRPTWMKAVGTCLEEAFLTQKQRTLATYVSEAYFTSLGRTLRHFLPARARLRSSAKAIKRERRAIFRATAFESRVLERWDRLASQNPIFLDLFALSPVGRTRLLMHLAKRTTACRGQVLFLVPELTLIPEWEAAFCRYFPAASVAALHGTLSQGPYFAAWEKVRSGAAKIVIATRQGLFAPFRQLGLVILLEEQDESYKQWDMSPRYDGRRVAARLASLHDARLLLASGTPSFTTRFRMNAKQVARLLPASRTLPLGEALTFVNLRLERFRKNYSPLSEALVEAIERALRDKHQVLLYIHRQGFHAFSVCSHCRHILRCPRSGHALTETQTGAFRCPACGYQTQSFPSCPECGHLAFRHVGFGTEKVEREICKRFPSARVFRADSATMSAPRSAQRLFHAVTEGKIDILIGTQMITKGPFLSKLVVVGIIDADSLLAFPDFQSDEKLFHLLSRAVLPVKTAEGGRGWTKTVIVQTFHPESVFFERVRSLRAAAFVKAVLAERQALGYPPFVRLLGLHCQGKTAAQAHERASALQTKLQALFPSSDARYQVSHPAPVVRPQRGSPRSYESVLLLRVPPEPPLLPSLQSCLRASSVFCQVDVDPLSAY